MNNLQNSFFGNFEIALKAFERKLETPNFEFYHDEIGHVTNAFFLGSGALLFRMIRSISPFDLIPILTKVKWCLSQPIRRSLPEPIRAFESPLLFMICSSQLMVVDNNCRTIIVANTCVQVRIGRTWNFCISGFLFWVNSDKDNAQTDLI